MEKPQLVTAKVNSKKQLNSKILEISFKLSDPKYLSFTPGQFVALKVAESTYRSYSIASSSKIQDEIILIAGVNYEGIGSNYLKNLKVNDEITFVGPRGKFVLDNIQNNITLFATGTGIAPFISYLYELATKKYKGNVKLFFGNRNEDELIYLDKLESFKSELDFEYHIVISRNGSNYNKGRVTDFVNDKLNKEADFYICGHPNMVDDVHKLLLHIGISEANIYYEGFTWSENS